MQRPLDFGETLYYLRNMPLGNHGTLFYRSPNEKHEMAFNFLQAGFEKSEGAIYIASHETAKQIRRRMEEFGWNVKALEKDGTLHVFDCGRWYIVDGEVSATQIMARGLRVFNEALEIGLKGLRGWGETACFFEHKKEKELIEYELMIGRKFDLPVTTLCAYDIQHIKSLKDDFFFGVIKAHGPVVTSSWTQEIEFENFLPEITDKVLKTVFGEIGKKVILRTLEERYSLTPQQIAKDPVFFFEGLEGVVGSGAQVIAKSLIAQMHLTIGITQ